VSGENQGGLKGLPNRMDLALTSDQEMIRDAADAFLRDVSASADVRAAMERASGFDESVWTRIAEELGWCGVAIDEGYGGLGLGAVELSLILESMGRHLLCAPFFSSIVVAVSLLEEVAAEPARAAWLPKSAEGACRLTAPLPSTVDWTAAAQTLRAELQADGSWLLNGSVERMPDAASADRLLVIAATAEGPGLFAVDPASAGVAIQTLDGWDRTRRFARVSLVQVIATRLDDGTAAGGYERAAARVRLALAAESLGAAQQCLDLTVSYVATRQQFGRFIASFQAVKHRCADMMVRIEALRSAVAGASALAATKPSTMQLAVECAAVRALSIDTLFFCAQEAIQLHGGVGFTWEYDPQLYFKRAQASSHWLGTAEQLREFVCRNLDAVSDAGSSGTSSAKATSDDERFRAEIAGWMTTHLTGRFAALAHRGGPGDEEADPELRKDWERELAAGGWTCVGWPQSAGGRGLSIAQQVIYHEEYARAGGPGRMGHIGEGLIGPTLIQFGTEAQKQRFLPEIVAGREYWAQGYSEPNAGSDLANVQTRCWLHEDGRWRVSGQKIWTSLAHESDWIFVLARSEPGSKGNKGLTFLLMPLNQPGIDIRPIRQLSGGAEFNEVFFDGAIAEADHVVGNPGQGWKVAMGLLDVERGVSTLGQQMHFAHELELLLEVARNNGRIEDASIRQRIAQAWSGLRVMRYNALRMLSGGAQLGLRREALIYKYYWSNWHRDLGKLAMDVLGPQGDVVSDDDTTRRLQQVFFFSRSDTIYAGTNEIQLNLIAERGLEMPREPRG
jgi:alkylation response protein AidB-like acyl-CoA dehydrogenase